MCKCRAGISLLLAMCFEWMLATLPVGSVTLEADMEWRPDTVPQIVDEDLTIPPGVELRIQPGTIVHIGRGVQILVEGTLRAVGRSDAPILFTGEAWQHLSLRGTGSQNSLLVYCRIERADTGILCQQTSPRIVDCEIQRNAHYGVLVRDGSPELVHNAILENGWPEGGAGILVEGMTQTSPRIRFNWIAHNGGNGVEVRGQTVLSLESNTIAANQAAGVIVGGQAQLVVVKGNNFIANGRHHLVNGTPSTIDARQNYWGWAETERLRATPEGEYPPFLRLDFPRSAITVAPWKSERVDLETLYQDWRRANPLPQPGVQMPEERGKASSHASGRGYVLHIFAQGRRVIIDYNKHDNVTKGMSFRIQRAGTTVGMLKVEDVHDLWSDAQITTSSESIRPGDRISLDPVTVQSDTTWMSSKWFSEDWLNHRLAPGQTRYWEAVKVLEMQQISLTGGLRTLLTQEPIPIIWAPSTGQRGKVYFRKTFDLDASPTEARLHWAAAVPAELYINERWVVQLTDPKQPQELDVTQHVKRGRNVIAIVCDRGSQPNTPYGFAFNLTIQQQPSGGD